MSGYLYVIHAVGTDIYKIGVTKLPIEKRLKELQTGCPYPLRAKHLFRVNAPKAEERHWHAYFAKQRMSGEWFRLTTEDTRIIRERYEGADGVRCVSVRAGGPEQIWAYNPTDDGVYMPILLLPFDWQRFVAISSAEMIIRQEDTVLISAALGLRLLSEMPVEDWDVMGLDKRHVLERLNVAVATVQESGRRNED